jgi:hypothetical protein
LKGQRGLSITQMDNEHLLLFSYKNLVSCDNGLISHVVQDSAVQKNQLNIISKLYFGPPHLLVQGASLFQYIDAGIIPVVPAFPVILAFLSF